MAVSRPEPGPLTKTSTFLTPCSWAWRAADSADSWAANGVDLREPLKPTVPDEAQLSTAPLGSVMVTMVLLNVDLMWAWPTAMFFFSYDAAYERPTLVLPFMKSLDPAESARPTSEPSSCLQRCASGPCGYERWFWCAVRGRAGRDGDEFPGS